MKDDIFKRSTTTAAIISDRAYNILIGAVLCWGFWLNWLIVRYIPAESVVGIDFRLFLLLYFASCFLGIYLFNKSQKPMVSFVGYNLVVVPFGFVINVVVSRYDSSLVLEAIQITAVVTISMMIVGTIFPAFFRAIARVLFFSLLFVIIFELVGLFFFHRPEIPWIDWTVAIIFCGYIGLDWGRANQIPKTVDNAIDSAAAIYMDIINLFLRILRILGRKK
ncbi:MAG: US12 family protein [Deltaproteobacteria bacterium]|nr:US12 family protein [Deltaproteobacteria bacterium]